MGLKCFLKVDNELLSLSLFGRAFHTVGVATEKARLIMVITEIQTDGRAELLYQHLASVRAIKTIQETAIVTTENE